MEATALRGMAAAAARPTVLEQLQTARRAPVSALSRRPASSPLRLAKGMPVVRAVRAADPPEATAVSANGVPGHVEGWTPSSWQKREAKQQPDYRDPVAVKAALDKLARYPPLVFAGEARLLQANLAKAARGEAFILQGGDCAESFAEFSADNIRDTFRVILQMSVVLMFGSGKPIVKIGRMAGQFAKPRSEGMETIDGKSLPSYRGDIINGDAFHEEAREPDPERLVLAYNQSAATLNLLRGFATGGYAAIERVTKWNLDFMQSTEQAARYMELAQRIDECMTFMIACGLTPDHPIMRSTEFYTSHECLLLQYEEALTRQDSTTGLWYDCSAHMVWCGERTRQLDCAHIEYLRGIANPIGIKISDKCTAGELVTLCKVLNPQNTPGRLTVIVRMGAEKLRKNLPDFICGVRDAGLTVTWVSDPMHGNTIKTGSGIKTRQFDDIRAELRAFFDVHDSVGSIPGGVHLEMTGKDVTECLGGGIDIKEEDLTSRYHTHCDPRLNASQALELAFLIADRLRRSKGLSCAMDNEY